MPFSPKRWQSKVFPYILVLTWTCLKDLYEDTRRRRDDRLENEQTCWRYSASHSPEQIPWRLVKPGDFVCTLCDEAFPADLLVCYAKHDCAFISTVNLDGETNLKLRTPIFSQQQPGEVDGNWKPAAPPQEASEMVSQMCKEELQVRLAAPCADLAEMSASVSPGRVQGIEVAGYENFVPRGCVLRNTAWILSIVAYAGKDTKQCLNSAKVSGKVSNMQRLLNRCVYGLLGALSVTCIYMATAAWIQDSETDWPVRCLAYAITLYHVVPISLYVAFEVLKLILGRFIDADPQMSDERGWARARTADLVEELGQVDFVFSDKTGTLTANDMRFARCCARQTVLASFLPDPFGATIPGREQTLRIFRERTHELHDVSWFFTCLALCHTVQVDSATLTYSGPSPDEVALVEGAHLVGVSFKSRRRSSKGEEVLISVNGEHRVFTVHHVIEFSAERKRMSVLCEHCGLVYCITKGADSIMCPLLTEPLGQSEEQLRSFSQMGLRTLVVASKEVPNYASWQDKWLSLKASLGSREELAEHESTMEQGLQFVGISAVEDKLQDQVPEAVAQLKDANIRLWVLTGDKTETAVDIAFSCNLFSKGTELVFLTTSTCNAPLHECLASAQKRLEQTCCGLVIDGQTLQRILEEKAEEALFKLAIKSRSCVCSRLSPAQKRQLVDAVRKHSSSITLAIGDGANDVPMILGAHLGIGLRGKEGSQAVQACDVAISQWQPQTPDSDGLYINTLRINGPYHRCYYEHSMNSLFFPFQSSY